MKAFYLTVLFVLGAGCSSVSQKEPIPWENCVSLTGERIRMDEQASNHAPIFVPPPYYPKEAINKKIEGYVIVKVDVLESGSVENVNVIESCPGKVFVGAAYRSAQGLRYSIEESETRQGKIEGVLYKYNFKLR